MSEASPTLAEYLSKFGLPTSIADREPEETERVRDLWTEHRRQADQMGRRSHLGLLLAFVAVVEAVCLRIGEDSCPDALSRFPPRLETSGGKRLNTLTLPVPDGSDIGLRGYYNKVEQAIRFWLARRSYPSMAPHATQAWTQHRSDLEQIFAMTGAERAALVALLWDEVLSIPRPAYRSAAEARTRPFVKVLEQFGSAPREPAGVVLQSLAYAYFNVELSHLTAIEAGNVRSGGARRGNVGDVDGWDASELVEAVEVKDLALTKENEYELAGFFDNLTDWPDATAIVVANSFSPEVEHSLQQQNIITMTRRQMVEEARGWDMEKQRRAIRALDYYIVRVQAHVGLSERFRAFLAFFNINTD